MLRTLIFKFFVVAWDVFGAICITPFVLYVALSKLVTRLLNYDKNA